ncbi:MAG: sigma-70 family RNA polymerase sigma factor [Aquihabitans sp.]
MSDDELHLRVEMTTTARDRADAVVLADPELVEALSRGSHVALAELYSRHGGSTHRLAARLCGTEADDVVQDVFLGLWRHPDRFDATRGSFRSFLLMQIRSRAVDGLRSSGSRRTRETAIWAEQTGPAAEDGALARLAGERCWSLLTPLNEGQRSAIALAYFDGRTYREVAVLLGLPEGTVKSRIRHGLTQLRLSIETAKAEDPRP